ncbi:hypothetical protein FQZ97_1010640 [compost metagenome]
MVVVLVAINEVLDPRVARAVLRACPVPGRLEGLLTAGAKGFGAGLRGALAGVGVTGRQAAGVVAIAEAGPVFLGGRLQVAVAELQFVAAGQIPVGEAVDVEGQHPASEVAAGGGHGPSVGQAIVAAAGGVQVLAMRAPAGFVQFALGLGRDDQGVLGAVELEAANIEAAFERGAGDGGKSVLSQCVHGQVLKKSCRPRCARQKG